MGGACSGLKVIYDLCHYIIYYGVRDSIHAKVMDVVPHTFFYLLSTMPLLLLWLLPMVSIPVCLPLSSRVAMPIHPAETFSSSRCSI